MADDLAHPISDGRMFDGRMFDGRTVIVTGGGAGIGGAISRRLASEGARVVINDIDASLLEAALHDITQRNVVDGGHAVAVLGDVRALTVVDSLLAAAIELGGGVDVLVNNVGDYRPASRNFLRSTEAQWQDLYEINLLHVLRCCHRIVPAIIERGGGAVVNVSTVEAFRGIPANSVYAAFKAGVVEFTRSLAVEVAPHGVRVNAIAPDMADTLQTPAASMLRGRAEERIPNWIPIGRFGQPDDYAAVVAFLASDAARFVTGSTIAVDGGTLAASGWYGRADGKGWTNLPDRP